MPTRLVPTFAVAAAVALAVPVAGTAQTNDMREQPYDIPEQIPGRVGPPPGQVPDLPPMGLESAETMNRIWARENNIFDDPGMTGATVGGQLPTAGAMTQQDLSTLPPEQRMAVLQARFNEVSRILAAESTGQTELTEQQINQLRQEYAALAQQLQAMQTAGVQPATPDVGVEMQIFTDAQGRRFVRADVYDQVMGGTAATADVQTFADEQGIRYYRIDQNNRPIVTGSAQ